MKVVTLVPWRAGDELREQSYEVVRPLLEGLGYPIFEGDREGVWSRGAAINDAAKRAGDWDVAVIADADTAPSRTIGAAVGRADATGGGIRPHDHLIRLSPSGSIAFARHGDANLQPRHVEAEYPGGGYLVVARKAFDEIGGFPPKFEEWGCEDSYFNIQLLVRADWDRISGTAYHLWHPGASFKTDSYRRNRSQLFRLRKSYAQEIFAANRAKGYDVGRIL